MINNNWVSEIDYTNIAYQQAETECNEGCVQIVFFGKKPKGL